MWQPDDESLKMLVDLLNQSQVPDNAKQREVHQKIIELTANPEFANYLVHILATSGNPSINMLRRIAGATLKGVLDRTSDRISPQNMEFVKLKLMEAFSDQSATIRSTVTNAITILVTRIGFHNWPELMKFLTLNLDVDHEGFLESSLECAYKIFEDIKVNAENFDYQDERYQNLVTEITPKLLFLCDPKLPTRIKFLALSCLNLFVYSMPQGLANNFNAYYDILHVCANDQSPEVRQKSAEGFLELAESKKSIVAQHHLLKTLERVIQLTMDSETIVKKVAIRFWSEYTTFEEGETGYLERLEPLRECLGILVPAIVNCLQYSEEDLLNDDQDKHEMVKQHANGQGIDGQQAEEPAENTQGLWTLRRESAKTLDKIGLVFGAEIFIKAQTKIAEALGSNDWHIKEAGILCLGALASGAFDAIVEHFNDLFPFLLNSIEDQHPLVRTISLWTLSKYTVWIVHQDRKEEVYKNYLIKILKRMMDESPKVQEASCTALSIFIYQNPAYIEHYIVDIIDIIKRVYEHYRKKSLTNLYDVISSLGASIPRERLQDPNIQATIMDILKKKWDDSPFNDRESIYLVECTDSIVEMIEDQAINHAEFFIKRVLYLIFNYIQAKKKDDKRYLYHKKEIAVRCFDLLGTFMGNIGSQANKYIEPQDYYIIYTECLQDQDPTIRKVALASGGESSRYCPKLLEGKLDNFVQAYMDSLVAIAVENDPEELITDCCNNSAWAIGEIALAYPNEFANYGKQFVERLSDILIVEGIKKGEKVDKNIAIALGRLGMVVPEVVAASLEKFLKPFCLTLGNIKNDPEKQQAFRGLFLSISKNPNGIVKDFTHLCQVLVNFENADLDLQELASKLVNNFKQVAGQQYWTNFFDSFPPQTQEKMRMKFGV